MSHLKAAASRTFQLVLVLWAVVTILFLMFRLMPGNPLAAYIDPTFTIEQQEALMAQFGLDRPLWEQYFIYLGNLLQGELGQSFRYREPVAERILVLLPNTLVLTFSSLIIAYAFGILAGGTALDDLIALRGDMDDKMAKTAYGKGVNARNIPALKMISAGLVGLVGLAELIAILF